MFSINKIQIYCQFLLCKMYLTLNYTVFCKSYEGLGTHARNLSVTELKPLLIATGFPFQWETVYSIWCS